MIVRNLKGRYSMAGRNHLVLWCMAFAVLAGRLRSNEVPATADVVSVWVAELDNDDFGKRESAMARLKQHASQSSSVLLHRVVNTECSPEFLRRALEVLIDASVADDERSSLAAAEALEELASSPRNEIASIARSSLSGYRQKRRQAHIARLVGFGATVEPVTHSTIRLTQHRQHEV